MRSIVALRDRFPVERVTRVGYRPAMASPRSRQAARLRARRRRSQQRARRLAVLAVLGVLGLVTLLLTAFGSSSPGTAPVAQAVPVPVLPSGRPEPEAIATVSNLRIQLPVAQDAVTEIGFHGSSTGARTLTPLGRQVNEGLLARLWRRIAGAEKSGPVWYQLGSGNGRTSVLDVGASAGTDVYSPVDGTVAAISDQIVSRRPVGSRIDIRPTAAPSVIVSLTNLHTDPSLTVGSAVAASSSKLGTVADLAAVEEQSLAEVTNDEGNNVSIEVHASPSTLP
jgi:hypothetical protein